MTTVQLHRVEKTFGGRKVLDGLDLDVPEGCYLVLLGPSGCGKTTTLRLIAGLELPDAGEVEFDGRSVLSWEPRHRDVSMVFQQDGLYPHLTLQQSLVFGLERKFSKSELESRVTEAAEMVGIGALLTRYPDTLSGGEVRRGVIAKAIVRRSSVRLLDEPLSALDVPVRYGLQQDLLRWHETVPGTTIHVTHDGREAMRMADQIAVLDDGRIVQSGEPLDLYQRPATLAVAKAIGSPPMNLFSATVEGACVTFQENGVGGRIVGFRINGSRINGRYESEGPVWIGARPEAVRILPETTGSTDFEGISFEGTVHDRRMVESQLLMQIKLTDGLPLVSLIASPRSMEPLPNLGSTVSCQIHAEDLHLFCKSDGRRIESRA